MKVRALQPQSTGAAARLAVAVVLGVGLTGAPGCVRPCEGAGCEDVYSGSLIALLVAVEQPRGGRVSPLDAAGGEVAGTRAQGPNWDPLILPDALLVGVPEASALLRFTLADLQSSAVLETLSADDTLAGEETTDRFGAALARVPDVDGDGIDELLVGAPGRDAAELAVDDGSAYLFSGLGAADGVMPEVEDALLRLSGSTNGGRYGSAVAGCADTDGDGLGDWAVAAPWDDTGAVLGGRVFLGLSSQLPAPRPQLPAEAVSASWWSETLGARAGADLSCDFDLLGPDGGGPAGLADLVVGAPFEDDTDLEAAGAVFIVPGEVVGDTLPGAPLDEAAALVLRGTTAESWLGWAVATGDLSGDGYAEVVAGAPGARSAAGQVLIWDGADLAVGDAERPRYRVLGDDTLDGLGREVAIADVDGDGLGDLLIGAPRLNPSDDDSESTYNAGSMFLFLGQPDFDGWETILETTAADVSWGDETAWLRTGRRIRAGDIDGDGLEDLALSLRYDPDVGVPE